MFLSWSSASSAFNRRRRPSADLADADVAERQHAGVIALQSDVTRFRAAELRPCVELGRRDLRFPVRAPQFVLDDLEVVQPMLHVRAFGDDARLVPFPDGLQVSL